MGPAETPADRRHRRISTYLRLLGSVLVGLAAAAPPLGIYLLSKGNYLRFGASGPPNGLLDWIFLLPVLISVGLGVAAVLVVGIGLLLRTSWSAGAAALSGFVAVGVACAWLVYEGRPGPAQLGLLGLGLLLLGSAAALWAAAAPRPSHLSRWRAQLLRALSHPAGAVPAWGLLGLALATSALILHPTLGDRDRPANAEEKAKAQSSIDLAIDVSRRIALQPNLGQSTGTLSPQVKQLPGYRELKQRGTAATRDIVEELEDCPAGPDTSTLRLRKASASPCRHTTQLLILLGNLGDDVARRELRRWLGLPEGALRYRAVAALQLARLGDRRSSANIGRLLTKASGEEGNAEHIALLVEALRVLRAADQSPALEQVLQNEGPQGQNVDPVLRALLELPGKDSAAVVERMSTSAVADWRAAVMRALPPRPSTQRAIIGQPRASDSSAHGPTPGANPSPSRLSERAQGLALRGLADTHHKVRVGACRALLHNADSRARFIHRLRLEGAHGPRPCMLLERDSWQKYEQLLRDHVEGKSSKTLTLAEFRRPVRALAASPDQQHLAALDLEGTVRVWRAPWAYHRDVQLGSSQGARAGPLLCEFRIEQPERVRLALGRTRGSRLSVITVSTREVTARAVLPLAEPERIASCPGSVGATAAVHDGFSLLLAGGPSVCVLSAADGSQQTRMSAAAAGCAGIHAVAFGPDRELVAAACPHRLVVWDADSGSVRRTIHAAAGSFVGQAWFAAGGRSIASLIRRTDGYYLESYRLDTGAAHATFRVHPLTERSPQLAILPYRQDALVAGAGVCVWSLRTQKLERCLLDETVQVRDLATPMMSSTRRDPMASRHTRPGWAAVALVDVATDGPSIRGWGAAPGLGWIEVDR